MELKDLIPPIAYRVRRLRRSAASALKQYQSFEDASRDCDTYEDPRVVEVVSRKTSAFREALLSSTSMIVKTRQTAQNMFVLSYVFPQRALNVLELGGACGASYFELSRLLPGRIKSWSVVETAAMAAEGRRGFSDDRLKFFEDVGSATAPPESFDLIVAQGTLQYTYDPLKMIDDLLALGCRYIYVTRTAVRVGVEGVNESEGALFTRQTTHLAAHGPGPLPPGLEDQITTQPLVLVSSEAIAARLAPRYSILFRFDEGGESSLLIGAQTVATKDVGFLAVKGGA
ncbi:MAG TPA: methyltransferase, TIGR04325 family [Pyrinomonadaceae bacterium]|jgi:putative methyltransferase (TIGR04325 family)